MANDDPADGGQELVHQGPPLVSPEPLEPDDAVEHQDVEGEQDQGQDDGSPFRKPAPVEAAVGLVVWVDASQGDVDAGVVGVVHGEPCPVAKQRG